MAEPEAPNVGQHIRVIREGRGLSLRQLAERAGLSFNAISLIERGETSPTVSSLHLLATALGVPIAEFFAGGQERTVVFLKPADRLRAEADGTSLESLGTGLRQQRLEPFLLTLQPGAGNRDQPITHTGEEFVFCLAGEVDYAVGDHVYHLGPGDSLLFEATTPHCFWNRAQAPASLMLVYHAEEGGHLARRLHLTALALEAETGDAGENAGS